MCWCWCWWCCVLIVCLYLKWYFYLGLSQLPARRPAKNYQAHKNKCARATGHQPAPGAGGGYITVCSRHLLQQQQHSSQGLRACTCSITITLTIVLWLGYVYGNRDLMCGCSSASHVSCIPQQSRPGWGPLSHSNGCNLIHNHGFTHIIAITSPASHCSDVRCLQLPRKCRYLVLPHRFTLYTAAAGGGGEIFRTMLLFQPDIWMTAGPGPCWNVVHCIVTEGGNYQGVKTGYFGHILSSSSTAALRCRCRWSKLPNLPIFVGKRCERKYAGWAGAGCRAAASSEFIENVKWNVTHQAPALHFAQLFCKQSQ